MRSRRTPIVSSPSELSIKLSSRFACQELKTNSHQRRLRHLLIRTRLTVEVVLEFLTKLLNVGNDRHRRRVAQRTEGATQHVLRQVLQVVDVLGHAAARMEARQRLLHPVGTFAAWDTPAAALVLVKLGHAKSEPNDAHLVVEDDHAARAEHRARLHHRVEVHSDIDFVRRENLYRRSTGHHALQIPTLGHAARNFVDHLLQVVAHGQLVHAGLFEFAAHAEQAGPTVSGCAQIGEPFAAAQDDVRHAGQRFGIIDHGWAAPQTDNCREGRTNARYAALAFERLHQGRLFADFVCARAGMGEDLEVNAGAEDVLADESARVSVGHGFLHDFKQVAVLAAYVDVSGLGADGERRNHYAFDDSVRIMFEDQSVLAGAGLALVTVAQHILRLGRLLGYERPLQSGGEARAATATQIRRLYLVDDGVRPQRDGLLYGLVAVQFQIAVEIGRPHAEAFGDDLDLIGMGNEICHENRYSSFAIRLSLLALSL